MKNNAVCFACGFLFFCISVIMGESVLFSIVMGCVIGIICFVISKGLKRKKENEVNRSYEMDMPDFMMRVAMFTEAGMGIQEAIERAVYRGNKKKLLYSDFCDVFEKVRKGYTKDFITGIEELAEVRKSPVLSNFCITVIQNMRKGSGELSEIFTAQAQMYRNERRRIAGKMADEAATLLIIPSALVLVALIVLLLTPAVMDIFNGVF